MKVDDCRKEAIQGAMQVILVRKEISSKMKFEKGKEFANV